MVVMLCCRDALRAEGLLRVDALSERRDVRITRGHV